MIRTYIRVEMSSEGESPKHIIERMQTIGAVPVVGDYDFELDLGDDERMFDRLEDIHRALRGSSVRYSVTTRTGVEATEADDRGRCVIRLADQKPVELKKAVYKAKLDRWREMGLDVSELESLLENDLDGFKARSKDFLRTHLDNLSVVKDKRPQDNMVDGRILAILDEDGKCIEDIRAATQYGEEMVTLSLGRLISSGSVRMAKIGSQELYCIVLPPAPPTRRQLKLIPASDDAEAEERVFNAASPEGSTKDQLIRTSRLPHDQAAKAIAALSKKGRMRVVRKGNAAIFYSS
jgi:hypothetical protein